MPCWNVQRPCKWMMKSWKTEGETSYQYSSLQSSGTFFTPRDAYEGNIRCQCEYDGVIRVGWPFQFYPIFISLTWIEWRITNSSCPSTQRPLTVNPTVHRQLTSKEGFTFNQHRNEATIPQCRLFLSLRSRIRQAFDCSPTNRQREQGLDCCETGCFFKNEAMTKGS